MTVDGASTPTTPRRRSLTRRLIDWAAGLDDGQVLRAAFFGMLTATVCVLVINYLELSARDAALANQRTADDPGEPILPAFDPNAPGGSPNPAITTDPKLLSQPMTITLVKDGVLQLTGAIDKGAADRFAAEIAAQGEYVKTVALDSPGGSVEDAMAMGKLIRDRGFATSVGAGALCASSCPLLLAGGKKRMAAAKAVIGVHQIYAVVPRVTSVKELEAAGNASSDAQRTTAEITRYLSAMGVDPALWLHALDTPPAELYYLTPNEMTVLKLVTNMNE